jgi:two-component system cell cycle response regulator DivK
MSASVMNEEVVLLQESGFDGVISKPINVASFPALIQRVANGESIWHITDMG